MALGPLPQLRPTCFCAQSVVHRGLGVAGRCGSTAPVPAIPPQAGPGQMAPATQASLKVTGTCKRPGQVSRAAPTPPLYSGGIPIAGARGRARQLGVGSELVPAMNHSRCRGQARGSHLAEGRARPGAAGRPAPRRSAPHRRLPPQTPPVQAQGRVALRTVWTTLEGVQAARRPHSPARPSRPARPHCPGARQTLRGH